MPKKKGLGRDVNKSLEMMEELSTCLKRFRDLPLKKGLGAMADEKAVKMIDDAKEKAYALLSAVENMEGMISGVKPPASKRFACARVVSKFLDISVPE